jgi:hypothetical protein
MVNELRQGDDDLIPGDYSDLLKKILEKARSENPFKINENRRLTIDLDDFANKIASESIQHPLGVRERSAKRATVHFSDGFDQQFSPLLHDIKEALKQQLTSTLAPQSIEAFITNLMTPLDSEEFKGDGQKLGFKYDFDRIYDNLDKQKLTLEKVGTGSDSILKFHKVTISVRNTDHFKEELQQGLEHYINQVEDKRDQQALQRILDDSIDRENGNSEFHRLITTIDRETLGKLKKEAKINYLEYLLEHLRASRNNSEKSIYLEDLIRRLRLIEEYINDPQKNDGDYEVTYDNVTINYRDIFSGAEVLDALPIIPIIEGALGETSDTFNSERKFIFGLKLKLNNTVEAKGGGDVFEYNLDILNPDSETHQKEIANPDTHDTFIRKVLTRAFLYYFAFASDVNPLAEEYDINSELKYSKETIFEKLDKVVLKTLKADNEETKKKLLLNLVKRLKDWNVKEKIKDLRSLLTNFIKSASLLPRGEKTRHLLIKKGLLEDIDTILRTSKFFQAVVENNPKATLQYITVEDAIANKKSICQFPVTMTFEDIRYFPTQERQEFRMRYNIKDIPVLPVLIPPKGERSRKIYQEHFHQLKLLIFPYHPERLSDTTTLSQRKITDIKELSSMGVFTYKFTLSLLFYLCFLILLEKAPKNLFIPMVRLHEGDHANPSHAEKFMANLSKAVSHLLSEKYRSNSQGLRIKVQPNGFKIRNSLSSLYSVLPKKFDVKNCTLSPEVDHLAMIIVSSQDSDSLKGKRDRALRKSNLLGEVIGINRLKDKIIQVEMLKTFSENYTTRRVYSQPPILDDIVTQLYQQGYRYFMYIAQAPYSTNLHIIRQTEEDEGLFFMSRKLIETLKGDRSDIKIYPIFFDKYYVYSFLQNKRKSFYVQDIRDIENTIFQDNAQNAVMFFNLFNGIKVEQKNDKNLYNGVLAYSTLLNVYQGILDDQDIREGLIYENSLMKDTLLNYLTFFHFSRYEARQNISLKLDPYEKIIGDDSLAAKSIFNHIEGSAEFNYLAFLTEVKNRLILCLRDVPDTHH